MITDGPPLASKPRFMVVGIEGIPYLQGNVDEIAKTIMVYLNESKESLGPLIHDAIEACANFRTWAKTSLPGDCWDIQLNQKRLIVVQVRLRVPR